MTKRVQMAYAVPRLRSSQPPAAQFPQGTLLTVEDVARYLQFTPETVRAMVRRGELPAIKVSRRWRFQKEKIDAWLQTRAGVTP